MSSNSPKPFVVNESVGGRVLSSVKVVGPWGCKRTEFMSLLEDVRSQYPNAVTSNPTTHADGSMDCMVICMKPPMKEKEVASVSTTSSASKPEYIQVAKGKFVRLIHCDQFGDSTTDATFDMNEVLSIVRRLDRSSESTFIRFRTSTPEICLHGYSAKAHEALVAHWNPALL